MIKVLSVDEVEEEILGSKDRANQRRVDAMLREVAHAIDRGENRVAFVTASNTPKIRVHAIAHDLVVENGIVFVEKAFGNAGYTVSVNDITRPTDDVEGPLSYRELVLEW